MIIFCFRVFYLPETPNTLHTVVIHWCYQKDKKEERKEESQDHLCNIFGVPLKKLCLLREQIF